MEFTKAYIEFINSRGDNIKTVLKDYIKNANDNTDSFSYDYPVSIEIEEDISDGSRCRIVLPIFETYTKYGDVIKNIKVGHNGIKITSGEYIFYVWNKLTRVFVHFGVMNSVLDLNNNDNYVKSYRNYNESVAINKPSFKGFVESIEQTDTSVILTCIDYSYIFKHFRVNFSWNGGRLCEFIRMLFGKAFLEVPKKDFMKELDKVLPPFLYAVDSVFKQDNKDFILENYPKGSIMREYIDELKLDDLGYYYYVQKYTFIDENMYFIIQDITVPSKSFVNNESVYDILEWIKSISGMEYHFKLKNVWGSLSDVKKDSIFFFGYPKTYYDFSGFVNKMENTITKEIKKIPYFLYPYSDERVECISSRGERYKGDITTVLNQESVDINNKTPGKQLQTSSVVNLSYCTLPVSPITMRSISYVETDKRDNLCIICTFKNGNDTVRLVTIDGINYYTNITDTESQNVTDNKKVKKIRDEELKKIDDIIALRSEKIELKYPELKFNEAKRMMENVWKNIPTSSFKGSFECIMFNEVTIGDVIFVDIDEQFGAFYVDSVSKEYREDSSVMQRIDFSTPIYTKLYDLTKDDYIIRKH